MADLPLNEKALHGKRLIWLARLPRHSWHSGSSSTKKHISLTVSVCLRVKCLRTWLRVVAHPRVSHRSAQVPEHLAFSRRQKWAHPMVRCQMQEKHSNLRSFRWESHGISIQKPVAIYLAYTTSIKQPLTFTHSAFKASMPPTLKPVENCLGNSEA